MWRWHKAITHGDQQRFDFILNRLIGKVTENVKHTGIAFTIHNLEGKDLVLGSRPLEEGE